MKELIGAVSAAMAVLCSTYRLDLGAFAPLRCTYYNGESERELIGAVLAAMVVFCTTYHLDLACFAPLRCTYYNGESVRELIGAVLAAMVVLCTTYRLDLGAFAPLRCTYYNGEELEGANLGRFSCHGCTLYNVMPGFRRLRSSPLYLLQPGCAASRSELQATISVNSGVTAAPGELQGQGLISSHLAGF